LTKPLAAVAVIPEAAIALVRVFTDQGYRCTNVTTGSFFDTDEEEHNCLWFDLEKT
jgi:hypothetical protein